MARRTQLHTVFDGTQVVKQGRKVVYNDHMHDLVSGKNERVHLSPTSLVCIRGRDEYDNTTSLGYAFLPSDEIFPFLELRSAAVDRSRKRKASHARDLSEMEKRVEAHTRMRFHPCTGRQSRIVLSPLPRATHYYKPYSHTLSLSQCTHFRLKLDIFSHRAHRLLFMPKSTHYR